MADNRIGLAKGWPLLLRRARWEIRTFVSKYPSLYLPLAPRIGVRRNPEKILSDDAELLIGAYPRSGNTFAFVAFQMAQARPIEVSHHYHAAAQVIAAVRRELPCMVIVRQPSDAVCSFVQRHPEISLRQALRGWISYHQAIRQSREGFLPVTFTQVTTDFGAVIQRLNHRFETTFGVFQHTPDNVAVCFKAIEAGNADRIGEGVIMERSVSRPSSERVARGAELRESLARQIPQRLRSRADNLYREYAELAEAEELAYG